jgi:predicted nucleotidyltransferase
MLENMALLQRLSIDEAKLDAFCRRWKIVKLELFGSMLTDPSRAQDADLLVTFADDARWGLFEHEHMQNELAGLLGRNVDLISRRAIESSQNTLRRNAILNSAVPVYVAG